MAVAATPALAFGPPGWAFFAVVAIGTLVVGGAVISQSSSTTQSKSKTKTKVKDKTCEECLRPWSIRVHAQGTQIGGSSGSTIGVPAIINTRPITIIEGITLSASTYALLTKSQKKNLSTSFQKCNTFILSRSPWGFLGKKSFYGTSRDNNRFDIDSFGITPNFIV